MLRRLGNKTRLLPKLLALFPEQITTFIDMFMGSGAVTFAMVDRAKYIIANDKDEEVFNLFMVLKEHKQELEDAIRMMPVHDKLFQYWKKQEEHDCIWKATRFLMLSNISYLGKGQTLKIDANRDDKAVLLRAFEVLFISKFVKFTSCDFREVLSKVSFHDNTEEVKAKSFIYADPPYIGTDNNYQESFTKQDTQELFELLIGSGIRFALSEFDNPFVLDLAQSHGLHVIEIGERQTLKNRQTEILITNYDPVQKQPSLFHGLSMN